MAEYADRLWSLLHPEVTVRTRRRALAHRYFGRIHYYGRRGPTGYWQAEMRRPAFAEPFVVAIPAGPAGPTRREVNACEALLGDADALFARAAAALRAEYPNWTDQPFPARWQDGFVLEGFALPIAGNFLGAWELSYFGMQVQCSFTVRFREGLVHEVVAEA